MLPASDGERLPAKAVHIALLADALCLQVERHSGHLRQAWHMHPSLPGCNMHTALHDAHNLTTDCLWVEQ